MNTDGIELSDTELASEDDESSEDNGEESENEDDDDVCLSSLFVLFHICLSETCVIED